ncbi:TonB-dependent receptor [Flavobacterium sp. GN10]|uniref:TonB-dependent receptor n=1 Tax=Flavobacterium tagetis TaxID=2801336 RepID=A0ABS1KAS4_9FLAO|nr:TonB-dependent receptor [Flavobacterium tagetis]MBL0736533.1 TonB-dependent receptor [Flavobacterium tagetis]
MKLTTLFLMLSLMRIQAGVYSQNTKLTLNLNNAPVEKLFNKVESVSEYRFLFESSAIDLNRKVTINVKKKGITEILKEIFEDTDISYSINDRQIILVKKKQQVNLEDKHAVEKILVEQGIEVTGVVTDSKNLPIPAANVIEKGTTNGVQTDLDGKFTIRVSGPNSVLVFSFIGFENKEVTVGQSKSLSVILNEQNSALNEVVVVGYGSVKKKDLTGAVATVKSSDILLSPVASPMEALQGRVSGLDIQRGSGQAGTSPKVLVRGNRSLTASQDPLYIIDGIPSSIDNLNTNDIETIDVLKDASSTAIYGSSGANGVIVVTTKKAKAGKTQIDFNSYFGLNGFSSFPAPLTGDKWLNYKRDKFYLDNGYEATSLTDLGLNAAAVAAIEKGQYVNWIDESLQVGIQQNHNLFMRGGSEKVQGYFSLGYVGEEGIYQNDKMKSFNSRGGIDLKFSDKFKTGFQLILNYKSGSTTNSRINKAYGVYPLGVPYDQEGIVNLYPLEGDPNNISILANNYPGAFANESIGYNVQFNPYLEIEFAKNFKLRSNLGTKFSGGRAGTFQNKNSYNLLSEGRTASEATYNMTLAYSYIWENILNYNFKAGKDHDFTLTGITSWADNRSEGTYMGGNGIDYDDFLFYNMGAVKNLTTRMNTYSQFNRMSFAGRINYSFKGKYLFQLTNRWDGVSPLAEGNKWSSFPSASVAWRISDESFMQGTSSWLNNLKLRLGYGVSGSANIDPYSSLTRTSTKTSSLSLGGGTALPMYVPTEHISNPDLTWERSTNTNLGLDVSVLRNRIDLVAEYYWTQTDGILWDRRLPTSSGGYDAKTPYKKTSNIATSKNEGFELSINTKNIETENFKWSTSFTYTHAKEKLTNIDLGSLSVSQLISEGLFIGQTPAAGGVFYDYKKIGIWQLGQEEEAALYGAKPGDIKLQTVPQVDANGVSDNGVHVYSTKDRMIVGNNVPDYFFGLQNTFKYKNFDFTVFVNGRYGGMMRAQVLGYWNKEAQPSTYDYWTQDNPTNDFPRPGGTFNTQFQSSLELVDASYIKIKNLTIGYSMPEDFLKKSGLNNLRLYLTAYNPFVFSRSHLLKDVDPENGGSDSFPLFKQVIFGLNLSL